MARKTYHHGNLRKELLDLASEELEQHGHAAISLRSLAARLGVASSAPYRHFRSRDDLLIEIARNAVEEMRQGYFEALQRDAAPRERLREACRWYLDFARRRPELYRLMFDPATAWHIDIRLEARPQSSFGLFAALIGGAAGVDDPALIHARAVASWAALHGYAMLRMNPALNQDGFVTVAEDTVVALAADPGRPPA